MAKFKIKSVFTISGVIDIILQGTIIDNGIISIGDDLILPWNSSFGIEGKISGIEMSDGINES